MPFLSCVFSMMLVGVPATTTDATKQEADQKAVSQEYVVCPCDPFTAKITKTRVRERLKPHLDSPIIKELNTDDSVIVTGTVDDFYAVLPGNEVKGYIYRSYILDGEIVGQHVNVRLEPETGPIIFQYNAGQKVTGVPSIKNNKWLEIALPQDVRFFVAKDFVSKIGDSSLFYTLQNKKNEIEERLSYIGKTTSEEMKKEFREIKLTPFVTELKELACSSKDWPALAEKAQNMLKQLEEEYLQKGIASNEKNEPAKEVTVEKRDFAPEVIVTKDEDFSAPLPFLEREKKIIALALETKCCVSEDEFYQNELKGCREIFGIVKPYNRSVKNAPGDYVLVNPKTNIPECFIYSTKINLAKCINQEVALGAVERPNNNFAYPAYFVMKVEGKKG